MKISKLHSIWSMACPRCRTGKLFSSPFSWTTAYRMHKTCPICQANFEPEPGFYYGAMFISYILTGWLFLSIGLVLVFVLGWSLTTTLIAVAIVTILVHNFFFRISRSIWIHFFIKYDPTVFQDHPESN